MQDVVLMEVVHALADLLGEQDHIQFGQVVLLIRDPVEELAPIHAAKAKGGPGLSAPGAKNGPTQENPRSSGVLRGPVLWPVPSPECCWQTGSHRPKGRPGLSSVLII